MAFVPPSFLAPFGMLDSAPVIPKLYWDVDSQEQRIHVLCKKLHELFDYLVQVAEAVNVDGDAIKALQDAFTKFMESGFEDYYAEQIKSWIDTHFASIISNAIKQVYFGITDDGYFCAYVPDSWSDIGFDTGMVYGRSDYGRLILRFDADGQGVINNVYESSYSNAQLNAANKKFGELIDTIITDLESVTRRNDETYETLYTNLDEVVNHGN